MPRSQSTQAHTHTVDRLVRLVNESGTLPVRPMLFNFLHAESAQGWESRMQIQIRACSGLVATCSLAECHQPAGGGWRWAEPRTSSRSLGLHQDLAACTFLRPSTSWHCQSHPHTGTWRRSSRSAGGSVPNSAARRARGRIALGGAKGAATGHGAASLRVGCDRQRST